MAPLKNWKNELFKAQLHKLNNYILSGYDTVHEESVLFRLKDFIAPKVLIFEFYECNLKLCKLILPYAKLHNHSRNRNY